MSTGAEQGPRGGAPDAEPSVKHKPGEVARTSAFGTMSYVIIVGVAMVGGVVLGQLGNADGRAHYVLATSFAASVLAEVASMGLQNSAQTFISRDPSKYAEVQTLIFLGALLAGAAVGAVCLGLAPIVMTSVFRGIPLIELIFLVVSLPFAVYVGHAAAMMIGIGKVRERAVLEIAYALAQSGFVMLGLVLVLNVWRHLPLTELVITYFVLQIMFGVAMFFALSRWGRMWARPDRKLAWAFVKYGFSSWVGGVANSLQWRVDSYFVNQFKGDSAFGVFNLATNMAQRSSLTAFALQNSIYQRVCASPSLEASRLCGRGFRQLVIVGGVIMVGGLVVAPLFPIIYGRDFAAAPVIFVISLLGWVCHNASRMFSMYFSGHLVMPKVPLWVNWAILGPQIGLTWYLLVVMGLWGAVLATTVSYMAILVAFGVLFIRRPETISLRELLRFTRDDIDAWRPLVGAVLGKLRPGKS